MDQWRHRGKWLDPSVARSLITYRFRSEVNWWIDGRGCERLPSINFHACREIQRVPGFLESSAQPTNGTLSAAREMVGNDPRADIGRAPGGKRHDEVKGTGRPA
jgi:hypothetical protein